MKTTRHDVGTKASALFVLAVLLGTAASRYANAEPSCMTEAEARAAYPRTHLYWHTAKHCWDNISGGKRRYDEAKPAETPPAPPQAQPAQAEIDKPALVQGNGIDGKIMVRAKQMTTWPPIIDLNVPMAVAQTEEKPNTADQEAALDMRNPDEFNEIDAMAAPVDAIQAGDKGILRSLILTLVAMVAFSVMISRWLIWIQRVKISYDDGLDGIAAS